MMKNADDARVAEFRYQYDFFSRKYTNIKMATSLAEQGDVDAQRTLLGLAMAIVAMMEAPGGHNLNTVFPISLAREIIEKYS